VPALVLFAFGLALRLWFVTALPDGGNGWHIGFAGDASIMQEHAALLAHGYVDGRDVLPLRPPGMLWLVTWLWDGEGASVWRMRLPFVVLGAMLGPLTWWLLRSRVDRAVAFGTALFAAASSNLLLLASGPHAETPYFVLVLVALLLQERLAGAGGGFWALPWGLLHGASCLLRAEHVLMVVACAWLAWRAGARLRVLMVGALAIAAPIVPWQLHANRLVADFNARAPELPAPSLPWRADALAGLRAWPGFQQAWLQAFVTDTVRVRGGSEVTAADLGVVREAFGVEPGPLRPAFVTIQGPLDFWFANTPESDDEFTRRALDRPLPLHGGAARYPPDLATRLPRDRTFSFQHPGHVHALVHGYSLGLAELAADLPAAAARIATKLWNCLGGATGGVGGAALPIGLSGVRRPVDLVVADGWWPGVWRVLVLAVAAVGLWRLRGNRSLYPLHAFAVVRVLVVVAYFGHGRHGALCVPVVALGVAAVLVPALRQLGGDRLLRAAALSFVGVVVVVDGARLLPTRVDVDGRPWTQPAGGEADWSTHRLTFR